ncbi:MAG: TatD family hydrolase [Lentisphaeria bacterium]|nr:TatD family hydrolase [Lentisphaeria bacterium]
MSTMLVDTHFHLQEEDNLEDMHRDALAQGVHKMLVAGAEPSRMQNVLRQVEVYPSVFLAAGVHPLSVEDFDGNYSFYEDMLNHTQVKAVGEIGLDYYYSSENREKQLEVCTSFMQMAKRNQLPAILHIRDSFDDTFQLIEENLLGSPFVVHCFSGTVEQAKRILDLGGHISFTGLVTFRNAEEIRDALKIVPLDRLMFETDSPYLSPIPKRGKRNKPAYVFYIVQHAAEALGMNFEELASISTQTAEDFFKI